MRLAVYGLLLVSMAFGQNSADERTLRELTADFLALRSLQAYPLVLDPRTLNSDEKSALRHKLAASVPEQDQLVRDLVNGWSSYFWRSAGTWKLGLVLTTALAGRDLSEDSAAGISNAVLDAFRATTLSRRNVESKKIAIGSFLIATARVRDALTGAGVSNDDAQIVDRNLNDAADQFLRPPSIVRPIPSVPSRPPRLEQN